MEITKRASFESRESSIEFLRLLLMFMIVVHHAVVHGLGLSGFSPQFNVEVIIDRAEYPLFMSVNSLCVCAVNCFVVISGFFGIRPTKIKFGKLLFALVFYTFLFSVLWNVYKWGGVANLLYSMMLISHSPYWFIIDYLLLMAFAPMLDAMFRNLPLRNVRMILGVMLFVSCYLGFVWAYRSNPTGYNFFQFMTMYCLGRYLSLFEYERIKWKKSGWLCVYVIVSLVNAVAMYVFAINGKFSWAWHTTYYNNPLVILAALSLFMVFRQLRFHSRFVNIISASALAVYLFQSSPCGEYWFYRLVRNVAAAPGPDKYGWTLLGWIMLMSVAVLIFSVAFDKIRIYIWEIVSRRLFRKRDRNDCILTDRA